MTFTKGRGQAGGACSNEPFYANDILVFCSASRENVLLLRAIP